MPAIKMPQKTKVFVDFEQESSELDQIKCPKCNTVQEARIFPDRKVFKKIHRCTCCSFVIYQRDWHSVQNVIVSQKN